MDDNKINEELNLKPEQPAVEPQTQPVQNNVEPLQIEEIQEEKPKKRKLRKGTIPKLFLSLILFVSGIALIIYSIKYEEPVEQPAENNTTIEEDNSSIYAYVGTYVYESLNEENQTVYDVIVLREDNTYIYDFNASLTSTPVVGNYSIIDGTITLEEIVSYGTDSCYYTKANPDKVFNTYTATIDETTITLTKDEKEEAFVKGYIPANFEVSYDDAWYSISPENGVRPENSTATEDKTWINCDNIEN